MNINPMPKEQFHALLSQLSMCTAQEFAKDVAPDLEVDWHLETLPYYPVLEALSDHCGNCPQCIADGDGETTCEDALVLEHAGHYEITQQFVTSLLN